MSIHKEADNIWFKVWVQPSLCLGFLSGGGGWPLSQWLSEGGECLRHRLLGHRPLQLWFCCWAPHHAPTYPPGRKPSHHPRRKQEWLSPIERSCCGRWSASARQQIKTTKVLIMNSCYYINMSVSFIPRGPSMCSRVWLQIHWDVSVASAQRDRAIWGRGPTDPPSSRQHRGHSTQALRL